MAPTLYVTPGSPPASAVLMVAKTIGLELNLKQVNLGEGEHKSPEFLKINPQHTIPTLVDGDWILWESHAIMPYLLSKYGQGSSLYPTDLKERALVDQRLHFDNGIVWASALGVFRPLIYHGEKSIEKKNIDVVHEAYSFLEAFLEGKTWATGDILTIADYSLISSITSLALLIEIDPSLYPNITAWLKRADKIPFIDILKDNMKILGDFFKQVLS